MFKRGWITKLHLRCTASCPVVFRLSPGNFHDTPEGKNLLNLYIQKIIVISWWIELMKIIKLWLWPKLTAFVQSFHLRKIVNLLVYTINNFINNEILLNDIFFVLNILEKFLLVMINLILFLFSLSLSLLFSTHFLCEHYLDLNILAKNMKINDFINLSFDIKEII